MAWSEWGTPDPKCSEYTNPIARWMGNCPSSVIGPVVTTPAAPRSIPEMTSGLWTPEEAMRLSLEKYTAEKQRVQDLYLAGAGGNIAGPGPSPSKELTTEEWILLGGLFISGLVVVKAIFR